MSTEVDPFNPTATSDGSYGEFGNQDEAEAMAFLSLGNTYAVWPRVGFTVGGTILSWEMRDQKRDGETAYFIGNEIKPESQVPPHLRVPKNKARQMKITIQSEATGVTWKTNQYEEEPVPDDDGIRDVYVMGARRTAMAKALAEFNLRLPEVGGYLEFTRGKNNPPKDKSKGGTHSFTCKYVTKAKNTHWTRTGSTPPGAPAAVSGDTDPFA